MRTLGANLTRTLGALVPAGATRLPACRRRGARPPGRAARGWAARRLHAQGGSLSVFVVIIAAVLLVLAGLCIEGGRVLNARATLTDHAEQAARAGAQQLADEGVREGGGISLDPQAAASAARSYLADAGVSGSSEVSVTSRSTVTVTVERDVPTTMLRLVGVGSVHVTATGQARTATGIYEEDDL